MLRTRVALCVAMLAATFTAAEAQKAHRLQTLHVFYGPDGDQPRGNLLLDDQGNLYGTTNYGGAHHKGTVYKLAPDGTETVLHSFIGHAQDGEYPSSSGLVADAAGNLYGTTAYGGLINPTYCDPRGCGTVFKVAPDGTESIIHFFVPHSADGLEPMSGLSIDISGNLYGTAGDVVFKIAPDGTETILHTFGGSGDGLGPVGHLAHDDEGNIYGATQYGGVICESTNVTCGTVFKIAPDGTESVLYAFKGAYGDGNKDGDQPLGGVIRDGAGNLYGTTWLGGGLTCLGDQDGCGTVFKVAPDGTETILHAFAGGADGTYPRTPLLLNNVGGVWGTTVQGGRVSCSQSGCGTIFKVDSDGTHTVLYAIRKGDGVFLDSGLINDHHGFLYGVTSGERKTQSKFGTVFRFKP
jgi:uncharacterized repeat protein (TIGR03803 family)